jgi:hypothetical protein
MRFNTRYIPCNNRNGRSGEPLTYYIYIIELMIKIATNN